MFHGNAVVQCNMQDDLTFGGFYFRNLAVLLDKGDCGHDGQDIEEKQGKIALLRAKNLSILILSVFPRKEALMHFERTHDKPIQFKERPVDPILNAVRILMLAIVAIAATKVAGWW